jgi:hypothetical protein
MNPVISQGFDLVVLNSVAVGFYERKKFCLIADFLGEKFWPDARPQVEKAQRRI